jgi:hypothetical protein
MGPATAEQGTKRFFCEKGTFVAGESATAAQQFLLLCQKEALSCLPP